MTKFKIGRTLAAQTVAYRMNIDREFSAWVSKCLLRHSEGDWGDVSPEDQKLNDEALNLNARIISQYNSKVFPTVWLITEGDRSKTTIIFPSEY